MANEIRATLRVSRTQSSDSFKFEFNPGTVQVDQAAVGEGGQVYTIGTSEEAISFVDITTEGWLTMQNLDATNYVDWGPEDGGAMIEMGRMEAGEPAAMRMFPGATLRLKANTAACQVLVKVLED
jgi:hypothetical protein